MVRWSGIFIGIILGVISILLIGATPPPLVLDELGVGVAAILTLFNALMGKGTRLRSSSEGKVFTD